MQSGGQVCQWGDDCVGWRDELGAPEGESVIDRWGRIVMAWVEKTIRVWIITL